MNNRKTRITLALAVALLGSLLRTTVVAQSITVKATLTADNHYALYFGTPAGVTFVGRNELGTDSIPYSEQYPYNWSLPEIFEFVAPPTGYLYIVAWSDHGGAQGLLGQVVLNGRTVLTSKAPEWEVSFTGINLDDFSPAPTESELLTQLGIASWQPVSITPSRTGLLPGRSIRQMGSCLGLVLTPNWIWGTPLDDSITTAVTETAATEYHIYRYPLGSLSTCESELSNALAMIESLKRDVDAKDAENNRLTASLSTARQELDAVTASVAMLVDTIEDNLRESFNDRAFALPGVSPLERLQNLVMVITNLQRGSMMQIYKDLGGKPGKK